MLVQSRDDITEKWCHWHMGEMIIQRSDVTRLGVCDTNCYREVTSLKQGSDVTGEVDAAI